MISELKQNFDVLRSVLLRRSSPRREALADVPAGLYEFWKHMADAEFTGARQDQYFFTRATEGLLDFFDCVSLDSMPCALPSKAADSVWRAWVKFSPARLDAFCLRHFGRTVPSVDRYASGLPMESAMTRTLTNARALEGLPRGGVSLPRLFTLDRRLRVARGFGYSSAQGRIFFQYLSIQGKPEGTYYFLDTLADPAGRTALAEYLRQVHWQPRIARSTDPTI